MVSTTEGEPDVPVRIDQMRRLVATKKTRIAGAFVNADESDPALSELLALHRLESELERLERILRVQRLTKGAAGS
jgi:hypothetical protein